MKKFVADTNILISALGWRGNEYSLILKAMKGEIKLCLSIDILKEFKEVALRPKLGFLPEEIDAFIEALIEISEIVAPMEKIEAIKEDPDDNIILECAVEGKADFIVSGDSHLLKLGEFKGIKILKTEDALRILDNNQ